MVKSVVAVHSAPDPPGRAKVNADEARRTDDAVGPRSAPPSAAKPVVPANAKHAHDPTPPARDAARDERATSKTNVRTEDLTREGQGAGRQTRYAEKEANGLLPRVEKLRQASIDMLDEATDDPSLRFVMISVTLFLCFLLIFLASASFH